MGFWSGLAKVGGAVGGFAVGGPAGAAAGYQVASGLAGGKRTSAGNDPEMADLAARRKQALEQLGKDAQNPRTAQLANDPAAGIQYNRPTAAPRSTQYLDRATTMQRPSSVIQNDAYDEMRSRGEFNYKDRAPANMHNDPLEEIKNFRGEAGDMAKQFASGGYQGGGGYSFSPYSAQGVGTSKVETMDERANVDELMNFDADGSFNRYMDGAQGKMQNTLQQSNEKLTNTAAGKGRLKTGFFDLDAGELGRQISGDYRNDVMSKALDTNQQKLSAITSGSNIRANDLNSLREQFLSASGQNAGNSLQASIANAGNGLDAARMNNQYGDAAASRDANFRISALDAMGRSDTTRLDAMSRGRDYMVDDRARDDKLFADDRTFARDSFDTYNDRLGEVGTIQRGDRTFDNNNFNSDRDFLMDADKRSGDNYENDRNYELDAWGAENDTRFKGGEVARGDREFQQGVNDDSYNRYLDMLAGNSDRAQGAQNAANTTNANAQNSRNDAIGTGFGVLGGLAQSRWGSRGGGNPAVGTTASNNYVNNARPNPRYQSSGFSNNRG